MSGHHIKLSVSVEYDFDFLVFHFFEHLLINHDAHMFFIEYNYVIQFLCCFIDAFNLFSCFYAGKIIRHGPIHYFMVKYNFIRINLD
jgi:hypothetical protein